MSLSRAFNAVIVMLVGWTTQLHASDVIASSTCVPAWQQFSGSDKLSSSIYSSIRANDGLIYLGGRDGLYRVAGGHTHSWFPNSTNPSALPSGRVKALSADNEYLWVGSNTGLSRLNTSNGVFERNDAINREMGFSPVNSLLRLGQYLYIASSDGGFVLALNDGMPTLKIVRRFAQGENVSEFALYNGYVHAASENGLWRISEDLNAQKVGFEDTELVALHVLDNALWVASKTTLYQKPSYKSDWQTYTRLDISSLPESDLTSLSSDKYKRLWIGSTKGLSRWNLEEPQPARCRRSTISSDRDRDISVGHISGHLGDYMFLGTNGNGAAFAPLTKAVRRVVPGENLNSGLPSHPIWSHALGTDGKLYAGTSSGLYRETRAGSGLFNPVAQELLGSLRIYSVLPMSDNSVWIGTSGGLFVGQNEGFSRVNMLFDDHNQPVHSSVFAIKQFGSRVLIASSHGLVVYDLASHEISSAFVTKGHLSPKLSVPTTLLSTARLWSIDVFNNRVFVAGNQGAFELDIENTVVKGSSVSTEHTEQPLGYIYNITVVDEDRVFIGTESGFVETDFMFRNQKRITDINGKKLLAVMSAGRDSNGAIWFGVAGNGLFQYKSQENAWFHLTQSKGLVTNGVSQLGLSFSQNSKMAVSNGTGASIIDLTLLNRDQQTLLTVTLFDSEKNVVIDQNKSFEIGPDARNLKLSFLVNELIEAGLYSVDYQLDSPTGNVTNATIPINEELTFVDLAPGIYRFSALVRETTGASTLPLSLKFEVIPHWWETTVFKTLLAMTLLLIIVYYFYLKTKHVEQRMTIIVDERKRIARELHDTSLQDLFGLKMLGRVLFEDLPPASEKQARHCGELINQAIGSLRNSVNSLDTLSDVPELSLAFESLQKTIHLPDNCTILINESGKKWTVKKQTRFFIYRIVREAVNNAAKHSASKVIRIDAAYTLTALHITVCDNGKGFNVSENVTGKTYGLSAMQHLAEHAKLPLCVESIKGKGTQVKITVPRWLSF